MYLELANYLKKIDSLSRRLF